MGPLLHMWEDSWADCPIQRQHKTHIMYIIFSVCLHRHSIGVLGGVGGSMWTRLSHLIYRLSAAAPSEPVEVWSYCLIFWVNPAAGNIFNLEFSRYSWCQGIASVLSFIFAFSGYLYCLFGCILDFYLPGRVELNVGQCVFTCCAWLRAVRPLRAHVHRPCCCGWSSQGHDSKLVLSFCLKNTCLSSVEEEKYLSYTSPLKAPVSFIFLSLLDGSEISPNSN